MLKINQNSLLAYSRNLPPSLLATRDYRPAYYNLCLRLCAVEGKRHNGTVMCRHVCANSACISQRATTSNIAARLSCKVCIFAAAWTKRVAWNEGHNVLVLRESMHFREDLRRKQLSHFRPDPSNLDLSPCDLKVASCQLLLAWVTSHESLNFM